MVSSTRSKNSLLTFVVTLAALVSTTAIGERLLSKTPTAQMDDFDTHQLVVAYGEATVANFDPAQLVLERHPRTK